MFLNKCVSRVWDYFSYVKGLFTDWPEFRNREIVMQYTFSEEKAEENLNMVTGLK